MAKPKTKSSASLKLPGVGNSVERTITKSVMSPLLILCAIALPVLGTAIYLTAGEVQVTLTYLFAFILISTVVFYSYFAFREPERLQSEDYRIEMRRIDVLGEPGREAPVLELKAEQTPNLAVEGQLGSLTDGH